MIGIVRRGRELLGGTDPASRCLLVLLLGSVVYLLERTYPVIAPADHHWAIWWPTNGILLALLMLVDRRHWFWIMLAFAVATTLNPPLGTGSLLEMAVTMVCNSVEVLVPAVMLPRFEDLTAWLQKPQLVHKFVLWAMVVGPALSSLIMGTYFHLVLHQRLLTVAVRWGIADVVGIVLYAPLLLALFSKETWALFRMPDLPATLGTLLLTLVVTIGVFHQHTEPLAFLVSPCLLLVGMRLGFSGSIVALNLVAPIATLATLRGLGPFALISGDTAPDKALMVQLFIILALLMALPISVARVQQQATTELLQSAYGRMEALACADGLTGLSNRRRFDEELDREWRRAVRGGQPVALLMIDVDHFKKYNDRYGHPAGDLCLRRIAAAIAAIPRRSGDLVARYGGEEFVVLMPGTDTAGAREIGERLRQAVHAMALPHEASESGRVTLSIGCASLGPDHGRTSHDLLQLADQTLYQAKQKGRDRCCVYEAEEAGPICMTDRGAAGAFAVS